jgi:hypothetical protein
MGCASATTAEEGARRRGEWQSDGDECDDGAGGGLGGGGGLADDEQK